MDRRALEGRVALPRARGKSNEIAAQEKPVNGKQRVIIVARQIVQIEENLAS